jgi:hypothetical protein
MPLHTPIPPVVLGTRSEALKRRREAIAHDRQERAEARFALARYLVEGLGTRTLSLRRKAELVRDAIKGHVLPAITPHSHESIRQHEAMWRAGKRSIVDYYEAPREPRRRAVYDPRLLQFITHQITTNRYGSVLNLVRQVEAEAQRLMPPNTGRVPKYDAIADMVRAYGPLERMAAHHGSRAAELYGQAHGTIACTHTHDIWVVDETVAPWSEGGWDWVTEEWVSVIPSLIVVREYKSGVPVGYHVSEPMRRVDELTGRPMRTGYDALDVFAALLAAACPELSPPSTRPFAGCLPRAIRWDNHSTHRRLGPILNWLGGEVKVDVSGFFLEPDTRRDEGVPAPDSGISTPRQRVRFPKARGDVENLQRFLKALCVGMDGHVDHVVPLDRLSDDPTDARTEAAAAGVVQPRREVLPPSALPSPEAQRLAFDARVAYYINTHHNRVHQRTAKARYYQFMPSAPRKGRDLLLALPVKHGFVSEHGIVVYANSQEHRFTHRLPGHFVLDLGAPVTYRVDPLFRGIWAEIGGATHYLPSKEVLAAASGQGRAAAAHAVAQARVASDHAAAVRAGTIDARHGAGAAAAFAETAKAFTRLTADAKRAADAAQRSEDRVRKLEAELARQQAAQGRGAPPARADEAVGAMGPASPSSRARKRKAGPTPAPGPASPPTSSHAMAPAPDAPAAAVRLAAPPPAPREEARAPLRPVASATTPDASCPPDDVDLTYDPDRSRRERYGPSSAAS